jgi:hypothetical protein
MDDSTAGLQVIVIKDYSELDARAADVAGKVGNRLLPPCFARELKAFPRMGYR